MTTFSPEKLSVEYKNGVSINNVKLPRKYTLTHSDETGNLFLTIGKEYDFSKIGPMRDEVLAQWDNNKKLDVFVQVDGNDGLAETVIRDVIFRAELPLALTAIIYGDGLLFDSNNELNSAPIKIHFKSEVPEYNLVEEWGTINDYKFKEMRSENIGLKQGMYPPLYPQHPYPPIPPIIPFPMPNPHNKPGIKCGIVENVLITMLDPYIKNQVYSLFGRKAYYCLRRAELLEATVVNSYSKCTEEYEVVVGLKVGNNPPPYNNLIIRFLVDENDVKIVDTKTPRG